MISFWEEGWESMIWGQTQSFSMSALFYFYDFTFQEEFFLSYMILKLPWNRERPPLVPLQHTGEAVSRPLGEA